MSAEHVSASPDAIAQSTSDWRSQDWYKVQGICCVCGSTHMIGLEPRFGYAVCEEHSKHSPVEISRLAIKET